MFVRSKLSILANRFRDYYNDPIPMTYRVQYRRGLKLLYLPSSLYTAIPGRGNGL